MPKTLPLQKNNSDILVKNGRYFYFMYSHTRVIIMKGIAYIDSAEQDVPKKPMMRIPVKYHINIMMQPNK